jgi:hypothetical protein
VYGQTDPVRCLICFLVGSSTALRSKVQCIVCGSESQPETRRTVRLEALWQPGELFGSLAEKSTVLVGPTCGSSHHVTHHDGVPLCLPTVR